MFLYGKFLVLLARVRLILGMLFRIASRENFSMRVYPDQDYLTSKVPDERSAYNMLVSLAYWSGARALIWAILSWPKLDSLNPCLISVVRCLISR